MNPRSQAIQEFLGTAVQTLIFHDRRNLQAGRLRHKASGSILWCGRLGCTNKLNETIWTSPLPSNSGVLEAIPYGDPRGGQ